MQRQSTLKAHFKNLLFILTLMCPLATQAKSFKDISYVSGTPAEGQYLDIHTPNAPTLKNLPVLIYIHGGAWTIGDKQNINKKEIGFYTNNGIILVSVNYRLSPKHKHPAHVKDIAAAVKWVLENIENYGGNPNNIVLTGHSAGAHLVALVGTHPVHLKEQGVRQNALKAILPIDTAAFDLTQKQQGKLSRIVQKMKDKAFGTEIESLKDASPMYQIPNQLEQKLSPFFNFVTMKRAEATLETRGFTKTLKDNGHKAHIQLMPEDWTHKDMNAGIFTPDNVISKQILLQLHGAS